MSISREEIVEGLKKIVNPSRVITDEKTLKENSHDRFRKFESIFGVYTLPLPAAVVKVESTDEVSKVLSFLNKHEINCVPRTGASATEGGFETIAENTVVVDGSQMNKIIKIDSQNMIATLQCGVNLGSLEEKLRSMGLTTGHSPQSKPLAQMGGLVSTRSIGQFSTLYGAIEDMVVGTEAVFSDGTISKIKNVPRRACGPDIRHIIIGNEGSLCYITEVSIKLFKFFPENNHYLGYTLPQMKEGFDILREVMVNGYKPSVARLYDVEDGKQHGFDKFAGDNCVLIFTTEGPEKLSGVTAECIDEIVMSFDGVKRVDSGIIQKWFEHLNWGPEKVAAEREYIKKHLNMGFTTEVSGNWSCINEIYENALKRLKADFPHYKDITMLGGHSSHSYQNGTNLYFVYDYNVVDCKPEEEIDKYHRPINAMIVEEALKAGGSMVHHHGIGKHRTQWTKEEHGSAYYMLKGLKDHFDPKNIMNRGTIFPVEK